MSLNSETEKTDPIIIMILYQSPTLAKQIRADQFNLSYWKNDSSSVLLNGGRGASQKIVIDGKDYVLRHYLRGGFMAKLSYDHYFWTGIKKSRPHQEQNVLSYALEHKLPVPECIAYSVERHGLFYKAAIITQYLPNDGTLASYLNQHELKLSQWQKLAQVINNMHHAHINHADLNADNILVLDDLGELSFSVIDFDKARIETNADQWPVENNKRLLRSLNKLAPIYFNEQAQQYFNDCFLALSRQ